MSKRKIYLSYDKIRNEKCLTYGMQLMEKLKEHLAKLLHADVESMTGLEVMEAIAQIWNEL